MPLVVHFINVGQGDCTLIEFPSGRVGLVDMYTSERNDRTDPFEYMRNVGIGNSIFRMIVTHPDMDHMTGLSRLASEKEIVNFWHIGPYDFNLEDATDWDSSPYDEEDWKTYKRLRGSTTTLPTSLHQKQGNTGHYWTEDGVEIWAPTPGLQDLADEREEPNISSMVLKISYADRTILLGGDATADETWPVIDETVDIGHIDILKASHHGRLTGYYEPAVAKMSPIIAITSVDDPEHDATNEYAKHANRAVRLHETGDLKFTISVTGQIT